MSEFTYYGDPDFPNGIEYDKYADAKIELLTNILQDKNNNDKVAAIDYFLKKEQAKFDENKLKIKHRIEEFKKKYSTKKKRDKANLDKKEVDSFNPVELKILGQQISSVIEWLKNKKNLYIELGTKVQLEKTNEKIVFTARQATFLFYYLILCSSNDYKFSGNISLFSELIQSIIHKDKKNISKHISSLNKLRIENNFVKSLKKKEQVAILNDLKNIKNILQRINIPVLLIPIKDDINKISNELEKEVSDPFLDKI